MSEKGAKDDSSDDPSKETLQAEKVIELVGPAEEESEEILRESERMLFFVDAAVAIGITLLLPLMDAAAELEGGEGEENEGGGGEEGDAKTTDNNEVFFVEDYFVEHGPQIGFFVCGFISVFSFWTSHVFRFAFVDRIVSNRLVFANALWLFTVMLVPLATTLLFLSANDGFLFLFSVFEANYIVSAIMTAIIRKYPDTQMIRENGPTAYTMAKSLMMVGLGAVSVVIGATAGDLAYLGYFPVFLLPTPILFLVQHCCKMEFEMSPLDKVAGYYQRANFVSETVAYMRKKLKSLVCRPEQEEDKNEDDEALIKAHRKIFSHVSERLIILTDASVAISMTLLIVPLSDRSQSGAQSVFQFFSDQGSLILGFVLSFLIVFQFWRKHDDIYVYVEGRVPPAFFVFTPPWLMTLVFIPVSTALLTSTETGESSWKTAQYILNLLLNRIASTFLTFIVFKDGRGLPAERLVVPIMGVLLGSLALVLSFLLPPGPAVYSLGVLFVLADPISHLLSKFWPGLGTLLAKLS